MSFLEAYSRESSAPSTYQSSSNSTTSSGGPMVHTERTIKDITFTYSDGAIGSYLKATSHQIQEGLHRLQKQAEVWKSVAVEEVANPMEPMMSVFDSARTMTEVQPLKRRKYTAQQRSETHQTRKVGACPDCKQNRRRCKKEHRMLLAEPITDTDFVQQPKPLGPPIPSMPPGQISPFIRRPSMHAMRQLNYHVPEHSVLEIEGNDHVFFTSPTGDSPGALSNSQDSQPWMSSKDTSGNTSPNSYQSFSNPWYHHSPAAEGTIHKQNTIKDYPKGPYTVDGFQEDPSDVPGENSSPDFSFFHFNPNVFSSAVQSKEILRHDGNNAQAFTRILLAPEVANPSQVDPIYQINLGYRSTERELSKKTSALQFSNLRNDISSPRFYNDPHSNYDQSDGIHPINHSSGINSLSQAYLS